MLNKTGFQVLSPSLCSYSCYDSYLIPDSLLIGQVEANRQEPRQARSFDNLALRLISALCRLDDNTKRHRPDGRQNHQIVERQAEFSTCFAMGQCFVSDVDGGRELFGLNELCSGDFLCLRDGHQPEKCDSQDTQGDTWVSNTSRGRQSVNSALKLRDIFRADLAEVFLACTDGEIGMPRSE